MASHVAKRPPISTHAPLAERDDLTADLTRAVEDFNPRAPCGARPGFEIFPASHPTFQPTRPLRSATEYGLIDEIVALISTHAPLAERDCYSPALNGR